MKYIHHVEFDGLPDFILAEVFIKNFQNFGLMGKSGSNCSECWETAIRLLMALDSPPIQAIISLTTEIDFFVDQMIPCFSSLTELNLSSQGLHDKSGIWEILNQLQLLQKLVLKKNCISEKGIKSFMLPIRIKRNALQSLSEIDLRENRISELNSSWFEALARLTLVHIDEKVELIPSSVMGICQFPNSHKNGQTCENYSAHKSSENLTDEALNESVIKLFFNLMNCPTKPDIPQNINLHCKMEERSAIMCSDVKHIEKIISKKRKKTSYRKPAPKKGRFKL